MLREMSQGGGILVPRLHCAERWDFNGSVFLEMVHSRWGTAPFKRINIRWSKKSFSGVYGMILRTTIEDSLSVYGPALEFPLVIV